MGNPVRQRELDRRLLRALRVVQRNERTLSHMVRKLTTLLQSGAKWNSNALLDEQKTPYHIICESSGDHHELLDLMIKSTRRIVIDAQDMYRRTPLILAVQNSNINCLKCLIMNFADVNVDPHRHRCPLSWEEPHEWCPIMSAIWMLRSSCDYTSVNIDIFDLLLNNGVDINTPSVDQFGQDLFPIMYAVRVRNVYCIKTLIEEGACLDTTGSYQHTVWKMIARLGDIELLKCMFNNGIGKDKTGKDGSSVLWWVATSYNVEAVRYLLDIGVVCPTATQVVGEAQCEQCKEKTLIVDNDKWYDEHSVDPCLLAIADNELEMVKLFEENGIQSCTSLDALRRAMINGYVDMVSYLLNKYTYPLNIEYINVKFSQSRKYTLLTDHYIKDIKEPNLHHITKLLLDQGADPAKQMCGATSVNALMTMIQYGRKKVIAQYIRSGVDINFRSYDCIHGNVLPLEASVKRGYHDVAEMLLICGSSCGEFSLVNNPEDKVDLKPELKKLMKEWKVQENNVTSLLQRCRCVILNHLSPRADMKIGKLPLPGLIIKFLSIPELDDILDL